MAIDSVLHTGQQSIDRVLRAGLPVVLAFWRRNVAQSRELDPILDEMARTHAGRILVAKVDAEAEPGLVERYSLRLVPSLVLIIDGKPVTTLPGRVDDSSVRAWLAYLANGGVQPAPATGPGVPAASGQPLPTNGKSHAGADGPATVRPQAGAAPLVVTDATFQRVIGDASVALVDFWAEWCGPCRMVAPSVDQLAREFAGRAVVAKVNVDQNPRTAQQYNIMSIPALLIFRNGRVVDQIVGAQPLPVLRDRLMRAVG